jgi:Family of unknown function (DUF5681)
MLFQGPIVADDDIGYGRPPKQSQFKPGVSGNPKGHPKREPTDVPEVIKNTLNAPIQVRHQGRTRTVTRTEVGLKKLVDNAVRGDLTAAATLLQVRTQTAHYGDVGRETVEIRNWLEDYPGQTAEQKSKESAVSGQVDSPPLHTQRGTVEQDL